MQRLQNSSSKTFTLTYLHKYKAIYMTMFIARSMEIIIKRLYANEMYVCSVFYAVFFLFSLFKLSQTTKMAALDSYQRLRVSCCLGAA